MAKPSKRPPIHMIDAEADLLAELAYGAQERMPQVSDLLIAEIDRAKIHAANKIPVDVVTMNATVQFVDEHDGDERTVKLVLPGEADIAAGRVSILTPVGAGLIGLREGQSIRWPGRDGKERVLRIVRVEQMAAA